MTTPTADLTNDDKNEILRRYTSGQSPESIGLDYTIHPGRILLIVKMLGGSVIKWKRCALSQEQEQTIVTQYRDAFVGSTTLAREYCVDKGTIYAILKRAGVGTRSKGNRKPYVPVERKSRISDKDRTIAAAFVAALDAGEAPVRIFERLGEQFTMHPTSITYVVKKQGIDVRSKADQTLGVDCRIVTPLKDHPDVDPRKGQTRTSINDNAFDVLTDDAAYWIGMLMADGCVFYSTPLKTAKRFQLGLKSQDADHIERFRLFLNLDKDVSVREIKTFGSKRGIASIVASSDRIIARLEYFGVIPNKTGYESAHPELAFNPHFWRGMVDGDGSIYPDGFYLSGPQELLHSLERFCQFYYPEFKLKVYEQPGVFVGHARSAIEGRGLLRILYEGATLALPRKYQQAMEALGH